MTRISQPQDEDAHAPLHTTDDFLLEQLVDVDRGEEFACHFLRFSFFSQVADDLFSARKQQGLSLKQLARRMRTTKRHARTIERRSRGTQTLEEIARFSSALGLVPRLSFVPVEYAHRELIETLEHNEQCAEQSTPP
jgi:hypothetical protein